LLLFMVFVYKPTSTLMGSLAAVAPAMAITSACNMLLLLLLLLLGRLGRCHKLLLLRMALIDGSGSCIPNIVILLLPLLLLLPVLLVVLLLLGVLLVLLLLLVLRLVLLVVVVLHCPVQAQVVLVDECLAAKHHRSSGQHAQHQHLRQAHVTQAHITTHLKPQKSALPRTYHGTAYSHTVTSS
jgi:hypothetical protein